MGKLFVCVEIIVWIVLSVVLLWSSETVVAGRPCLILLKNSCHSLELFAVAPSSPGAGVGWSWFDISFGVMLFRSLVVVA